MQQGGAVLRVDAMPCLLPPGTPHSVTHDMTSASINYSGTEGVVGLVAETLRPISKDTPHLANERHLPFASHQSLDAQRLRKYDEALILGDEYGEDGVELSGTDEVLCVSCGKDLVPPVIVPANVEPPSALAARESPAPTDSARYRPTEWIQPLSVSEASAGQAPNTIDEECGGSRSNKAKAVIHEERDCFMGGKAKSAVGLLRPQSRLIRYEQLDDSSSASIEIATRNSAAEEASSTRSDGIQNQNAKTPQPLTATATRRWLPHRSLAMLLLGSCCVVVGWAAASLYTGFVFPTDDTKTLPSPPASPPVPPSTLSPLLTLMPPPHPRPSPPPMPARPLSPPPQLPPVVLPPLLPPPQLPISRPPLLPAVKWWPSPRSSPDNAVLQSRNEGTCAVVGGGYGLVEGSFGAEIDEADVVVRVNRLPRPGGVDTADLGRRTDAYFKDQCHMNHAEVNGHFALTYVGGGLGYCNLMSSTSCPFTTLILRGNDARWEPGCIGETQQHAFIRDAAAITAVHIGVETDLLLEAVFDLRGFQAPSTNKPTTGLHALVAVALLCSHVRLYGFAGTLTVDGHEEDGFHNIEAEHALLAELAAKGDRLERLAIPATLRQAWAGTNVTVVC